MDFGGLASNNAFGGGRAPVLIALTTGVITAFNPCGFAMLPAYVSYFVGSNSAAASSTGLARRLGRAAITGATVTAGFMTVFGSIGLVATKSLSQINGAVPYVSMVVGIALAALGVAMLRGFEPKLSFLKVRQARSGSSLWSMYLYGISYAVVSLSCGFAGFLTTVVSASSERSLLSSMGVYAAFTAGMGLVLVVLSFAVALAQQAFVRGLRRVLPYVNKASGTMLVVAGLYVAYYGYYEWTTIIRGRDAPAGPVNWVTDWSSSATSRIGDLPTAAFLGAAAAIAAMVTVIVVSTRRNRALPDDPQQGAT